MYKQISLQLKQEKKKEDESINILNLKSMLIG